MKILWAINVYSRVNNLRLQQELIRHQFGDSVDIFTFTNNTVWDDSVFNWKEDFFYKCEINAGGHTGTRDSYNYLLTLVDAC